VTVGSSVTNAVGAKPSAVVSQTAGRTVALAVQNCHDELEHSV
jgi:hypothetical protein